MRNIFFPGKAIHLRILMRVSLFLGSVTLPALAVDLDPQRVGGYDTSGNAADVAVSGNYAYLTDADVDLQPGSGFLIIDVSNPANPQRVGGNSALLPSAVAVTDSHVFVAAGDRGLFILNHFTPLSGPALPGDWPTFGKGPAHTGYFPGKLNGLPFVFKWQRHNPSYVASQPAVAGGRVFVSAGLPSPSTGVSIRAFDANTGQPLWTNLFSGGTTISPPTHDAGAVYFQQTSPPYLFSLDAATGSTNWATLFDAQSFRYMAPVVGGGRVFADIGNVHGLGSFDQVTGTNQWFVPQDGFSYEESAPAYYNGKVYTWLGNFTEWNPTNGAVNWRLTNGLSGDASRRTVAIADGRAYFVGDKLYCVNLATRTNEWAVSGSFGWTPVVANGIVYAISNKVVSAFTTNGVFVRQFGSTSLEGEHYGPLIVTDDVLIAVRTQGINVYRLADGSLQQYISSFFMECFCYLPMAVALANNTLYVSSGLSLVIAYAATPTTDVTLINPAKVGDGNFRFGFTNTPGATFTAWASTNVALPLANWTPLGYVTQFSPGQYQFTDLQATNHPQRYYRISSP